MHYVIGNISIFFGSFTSSAALSAGVPACQTQKAYALYSHASLCCLLYSLIPLLSSGIYVFQGSFFCCSFFGPHFPHSLQPLQTIFMEHSSQVLQ